MSIYIQVCMHPLVFFLPTSSERVQQRKGYHTQQQIFTRLYSFRVRGNNDIVACYVLAATPMLSTHHRAVGMSWAQTQPCAYIDRIERVEERELARIKEETSREKVKKVGFSKFFPQAWFYSHIQTHAYLYTHADKYIHTRNAYIQLHKHTDMYAHTCS